MFLQRFVRQLKNKGLNMQIANYRVSRVKDQLATLVGNLQKLNAFRDVAASAADSSYYQLGAAMESIDNGIIEDDLPVGSTAEKQEQVLLRLLNAQLKLVKENVDLSISVCRDWGKLADVELNDNLLKTMIDNVSKPAKTFELLSYARLDENSRNNVRKAMEMSLDLKEPISIDTVNTIIDSYNAGAPYNVLFRRMGLVVKQTAVVKGEFNETLQSIVSEDNIEYLLARFDKMKQLFDAKPKTTFEEINNLAISYVRDINPAAKYRLQQQLDATSPDTAISEYTNQSVDEIGSSDLQKIILQEKPVNPLTKNSVNRLNAIVNTLQQLRESNLPTSIDIQSTNAKEVEALSALLYHIALDMMLNLNAFMVICQVATRNTLVYRDATAACKTVIDKVDTVITAVRDASQPNIGIEALNIDFTEMFKRAAAKIKGKVYFVEKYDNKKSWDEVIAGIDNSINTIRAKRHSSNKYLERDYKQYQDTFGVVWQRLLGIDIKDKSIGELIDFIDTDIMDARVSNVYTPDMNNAMFDIHGDYFGLLSELLTQGGSIYQTNSNVKKLVLKDITPRAKDFFNATQKHSSAADVIGLLNKLLQDSLVDLNVYSLALTPAIGPELMPMPELLKQSQIKQTNVHTVTDIKEVLGTIGSSLDGVSAYVGVVKDNQQNKSLAITLQALEALTFDLNATRDSLSQRFADDPARDDMVKRFDEVKEAFKSIKLVISEANLYAGMVSDIAFSGFSESHLVASEVHMLLDNLGRCL